jgi:hypothetical protein
MWTRTLLKDNAKACLRKTYWRAFLFCFVATLLTGSLALRRSFFSIHLKLGFDGLSLQNPNALYLYLLSLSSYPMVIATVISLVLTVMVLAWELFAVPVVQVGWCRVMMENRVGNPPLDTIYSGFSTNYWNLFKGRFYANLRIFLYSLLLIVPGVVKYYQYVFVPYLLAENPNLTPARTAELSAQMTDGEKWNIFLLDLSFIGWRILGALLFGIGNIFVEPYYRATMAELYAAMRAKSLARGITDENELGGFVRYE